MPASPFSLLGGPPPRAFHAILVAGSLVLFLGGLLSDWAYASTHEIQWTNFAAWLVAAASFLAALAVIFALVEMIASRFRTLPYAAALALGAVLGIVNSFIHAKDAWAAMPMALILSIVSTAVMSFVTWALFSRFHIAMSSSSSVHVRGVAA